MKTIQPTEDIRSEGSPLPAPRSPLRARSALFSDPIVTGPHYIRRATGVSLSLVEKLIGSHIRVEGVEHVPEDGPVLFLANHFTRFETFILPWLLDRHTKRFVCNLAHHSLFAGRFGDYLQAIGARSTKEPGIKESIVADLITGHHDWVIYPEGSMIKDKHVWRNNRFELDAPDRHGPPHTGAALMAVQAAAVRARYLAAWAAQDHAVLDELEERWHFTGANLPRQPLRIIPVTITYYPLRPGDNAMIRLARRLLKQVPEQLNEELAVEGNLLLGDTDISVYLGEPLGLEAVTQRLVAAHATPACEQVLADAKDDLTNQVMGAIYRHVTVNFDHLFACALRYAVQGPLARERMRCEDLHRVLYLAARTLQARGSRRRHPSLDEGLLALVTGETFAPLVSAIEIAVREGVLVVEDGWYNFQREAILAAHAFHDVRMKNTLHVIANELEPLRPAVRAVRQALNLAPARLRQRTAEVLAEEDQSEWQRDWRMALSDSGVIHGADVAAPFVVGPSASPHTVVACHGYLAAPGEMLDLAQHLGREGWRVFGSRLSGHGTSADQLARTTRADWRYSLDRSLAAARASGERTVLVGFSMGGLLCLDAAARLPEAVAGVVAINIPLRLQDPASRFVPLVDRWNSVAHALHLDRLRLHRVPNRPEHPDINYDENPVAGIHELERLIGEAPTFLPRVRCPVLLLQADQDPVVGVQGAHEALRLLGTDEKRLQLLNFDRHVIVRGDGCGAVFAQVADFLAELRRSW